MDWPGLSKKYMCTCCLNPGPFDLWAKDNALPRANRTIFSALRKPLLTQSTELSYQPMI